MYKIRDRGPAGGYVFYDKGNASDGWQYLEAHLLKQSLKLNGGRIIF